MENKKPEEIARSLGFLKVAGVDEAGRGPWAGPVVASAVCFKSDHHPVRIDDSKRLSPSQREAAYKYISDVADIGVGVVCADQIDKDNILQASLLAMRLAVGNLEETPDLLLIDGSIAPMSTPTCWPIIKGDQLSTPIAAASIVAKVIRDRLMCFYHELIPQYEFNRHKGYGTALHSKMLDELGPSFLHRKSFSPVARSMKRSPKYETSNA